MLDVEILLQGIGILINWNAILTSFDWLNTLYPGYNVGIVFTLLNISPVVVFQPLTLIYGSKFSYNLRIVGGYVVICLVLIIIPILAPLLPEREGFVILCVIIFIMGTADVIAQVSVYGLAGTLPRKFMNLVMVGNAIAGIVISVLRLVCLAAFTDVKNGLLLSSLLYYICAGIIMIICIVVQIHLMRHPLVIRCTRSPEEIISSDQSVENFKTEIDPEDRMINKATGSASYTWKSLFEHIWEYFFLIWVNYIVTFGMLTHVALATEVHGLPYSYLETLLILDFNIFDFLGKNLCAVYLVKRFSLWVCSFGRFIFWVTLIMIASDHPSMSPSWLFGSTWFKFLNMALYAFTNGYFSTVCMIRGPASCPKYMKDRAGYMMGGGLKIGILTGTLIAFAFSNVGHIPSD